MTVNEPSTSLFPEISKLGRRKGRTNLRRIRFGSIKFIISPLLLGCDEKEQLRVALL